MIIDVIPAPAELSQSDARPAKSQYLMRLPLIAEAELDVASCANSEVSRS